MVLKTLLVGGILFLNVVMFRLPRKFHYAYPRILVSQGFDLWYR